MSPIEGFYVPVHARMTVYRKQNAESEQSDSGTTPPLAAIHVAPETKVPLKLRTASTQPQSYRREDWVAPVLFDEATLDIDIERDCSAA